MKKTFALKRCLSVIIGCQLLITGLLSIAYSDTDIERQVKISFIYNYAKFVTWPDAASDEAAPLNFCIIGSQQLADGILQLNNKKVNARTIQVHSLNQDQPTHDCNIVFVSESESSRLDKKLSPLATLPILTISTIPHFVQAGGMIGLKVLDNRVRFDINLLAVQKVGLSIDSQLSSLADEVIK